MLIAATADAWRMSTAGPAYHDMYSNCSTSFDCCVNVMRLLSVGGGQPLDQRRAASVATSTAWGGY
jgi:hypothetical protein